MVADKKKTSTHIERDSNLDRFENDRHNDNARAAAALEPEIPRITLMPDTFLQADLSCLSPLPLLMTNETAKSYKLFLKNGSVKGKC
jgi:hypothetical protein